MMLGECLGMTAPYYNLVLVAIVIFLFAKLFTLSNKKVYMLPWKLLFAAVLTYVIEELLTVFHKAGIFIVPRILNAVFEFIIIIIFIYSLLMQKQYVESSPRINSRRQKNAR